MPPKMNSFTMFHPFLWMFWKRICSCLKKKGKFFKVPCFCFLRGGSNHLVVGTSFDWGVIYKDFGIFWANSERIRPAALVVWIFVYCVYIYIRDDTTQGLFISHEISGSQLLNQSFAQMRLPWWTCNCWIWILRSAAVSSSVVSINLWFQSFWKGLKQTTTVFSVIFPISFRVKDPRSYLVRVSWNPAFYRLNEALE